jgi:predicted ATPase with chaperone activity
LRLPGATKRISSQDAALDLDGADKVSRVHLAEALSYRALVDEVRRAT